MKKILKNERELYYKKNWKKWKLKSILQSLFQKIQPSSNKLTIVIPIFNAAEEVEKCMDSIFENTASCINIILVNDASTDHKINELLDCYDKLSTISIINNPKNLGYTKSINIAIKSCETDIIILNSDTEVTPYWAENITRCAYSSKSVGTVTPFSNNAGAFSAPQMNECNELPYWSDKNSIGRAVTANSLFLYPEIPTGNGFCMFIKRSLIERIGYFDEVNFPKGYGEENDFCLRAKKAGWKNILDDSTFIFHKRTASFKDEKEKLIIRAKRIIRQKYPTYQEDIKYFYKSELVNSSRIRIRQIFEDYELTFQLMKPTILYVLHKSSGGTPATSNDLAKAIEKDYRILFFTSDRKSLYLYLFSQGKKHLINKWLIKKSLYPTSFTNKKYSNVSYNILLNYNVKIVHVRHLIYHTFDILFQARKLNIKTIISFHDFYFICPTVHLLDENNIYCAGNCTKTKGECKTPYDYTKKISKLKNNWIKKWKEQVSLLLDHVDYFVTTSKFTKETYVKNYPKLNNKNFDVIHHGRDFTHSVKFVPNCDESKIKILCPGNLGNNKGIGFISQLVNFDKDQKIEIHILGSLSNEAHTLFEGRIISHGKYDREDFHLFVNKIKPHFVGIFSIWPETYCHTMTESWSCGIPVLINAIGTLSERLAQNGGGGWELNCNDISLSYKRILAIYGNKKEYYFHKNLCNSRSILSVEYMADNYKHIYKKLIYQDNHKIIVHRKKIISKEILKVGLFIPNRFASYFIRIENYLKNIYTQKTITLINLIVEDFIDFTDQYKFDIIIIQRHAINPKLVESIISRINKSGAKLIYEIDDDLVNIDSGYYGNYSNSIKSIISNSHCIVTTNNAIRDQFLMLNKCLNIKVIKNRLNNNIWGIPKLSSVMPRSYTNLLYMGTKTHTEDLYLILEPLRRIAKKYNIKLTLIGITKFDLADDFIIQKSVPFNFQEYPYFVRLLKSQKDLYDIGIAPLVTNQLNINKSNIKYLDYTALGIPGIYSNIDPYSNSIKTLENGILVENTSEEWQKAIELLLLNKELRLQLAQNAVNDINKNFLLEDDPYAYSELLCDFLNDE